MIALNSGFSENLFPRTSGIVAGSALSGARFSTVQSSGAGTPPPEWPVLSFGTTAVEGRLWNGTVPRLYASTMTLSGMFYAATATSGSATFNASIACWSDGDAACTAKTFGTVATTSVDVPGTAGVVKAFSITMTDTNGAAAVDSFCVHLSRGTAAGQAGGDIVLKRLDMFFNLI
jgi:hypothetical protein